jgi:hypothetical protein
VDRANYFNSTGDTIKAHLAVNALPFLNAQLKPFLKDKDGLGGCEAI